MPRFDKTGPNGRGLLTGRGLGKCDENHPKQLKQDNIKPLDSERGLGNCFRNWRQYIFRSRKNVR
jgi:hypothetical protein